MVPSRQTADERRTAVLAAAISEFARSGYAGTSTEAIARRAGISQPYLFRLFGTKKDLFIATFSLVGRRIVEELGRAADGRDGPEAMEAMGLAYTELMQDPELLQVELHGYAAAAGDADIARSCRDTFEAIQRLVIERTDASDEEISAFFATGMLINVAVAIDLASLAEPWAQRLCPGPDKSIDRIQAMSRAVDAHRRAEAAAHKEVPA